VMYVRAELDHAKKPLPRQEWASKMSRVCTDSRPDSSADRLSWQAFAECRDHDPEIWFPVAQSGAVYEDQVAEAKRICARCPVVTECLLEAMNRIPHGIVGGLTEKERQDLRRDARV
jgi:transcription factor WhiB